jgi:hypothetical protein
MPCLIAAHSVRAMPEIDGGGDHLVDAVAPAEHEQQVGRPELRRDQVFGVDPRDLAIARQIGQFRNSAITR